MSRPKLLSAIPSVGLTVLTMLLCFFSSSAALTQTGQRRPSGARAARSTLLVAQGGFVSRQWGRYLEALESTPMPTKMATAALLSGTGDIIAQGIEASGPFAVRRLLTLVSVNVLYIVPILTGFYAVNERLAKASKLPAGWKRTSLQLAFDQLVNAPIVIFGFFCAFQTATAIAEVAVGIAGPARLSGVTAAVWEQLRSSYFSTVLSNWVCSHSPNPCLWFCTHPQHSKPFRSSPCEDRRFGSCHR